MLKIDRIVTVEVPSAHVRYAKTLRFDRHSVVNIRNFSSYFLVKK